MRAVRSVKLNQEGIMGESAKEYNLCNWLPNFDIGSVKVALRTQGITLMNVHAN